jgi:hypothetical protein
MAFAAPQVNDLFGGLPAEQRVDRFEQFKSVLAECQARSIQNAASGATMFVRGEGIVKSAGAGTDLEALRSEMTSKAMTPDQAADVQSALDRLSELNKDWSLTNPLSTSVGTFGMVPYDLDPALALLVPRSFVVRNSVARVGGIGQAKEYRRITGVSNSGTGGVSNLNTFFSSASVTSSWDNSNITRNRPAKISYAADRHVVSYMEQGVSDAVSMQAQFAGQGYADLRQLSHTAALWAHMIGEERNLITARGTGTGYTGALATPVVGNFTTAATTGGTLSGTLYFKITYDSGFGETLASAEGSQALSSNTAVTITAPSTLPAAAVRWWVYSGTSTGVYTQKTAVVGNSVTITAAGSGSFTVPAAGASASSAAYDGLIATYTDTTQSGYVNRLNGTLSTSEPGKEFQDAFASLYSSVIADPDAILTDGGTRRNLAKAIQASGGSSTGYRINYDGGDGVNIGSVVTGLVNEVTGKLVDVIASPYMPSGVALIWTKQLPFPDSGVTTTTEVANVQDMMVIEWPVTSLNYELSTYQFGTMLHRAPAWSGAITGITG